MRKGWIVLSILSTLFAAPFEGGAKRRHTYITVAAGALDRRDAVVSFAAPKDLKGETLVLRDESGHVIPVQVDAEHQATFVLPELKAGTTKRYRLEELKGGGSSPSVQAVHSGDKLALTVGGRPALDYQAQPGAFPRPEIKEIFRRGGYISPLYTPGDH